MKNILGSMALAAMIAFFLQGCSGHIKKTESGTYTVRYKSYKSEEDARKQATFEATLECTGQGKNMNILEESKETKRGYLHSLEFECVDQ